MYTGFSYIDHTTPAPSRLIVGIYSIVRGGATLSTSTRQGKNDTRWRIGAQELRSDEYLSLSKL